MDVASAAAMSRSDVSEATLTKDASVVARVEGEAPTGIDEVRAPRPLEHVSETPEEVSGSE